MRPARARDKIVELDALLRRVARARRAGERIVFTNGCFDLLHVGHLRGLEQARALGDRLIVAVNDDASVRRAKGEGRPLRPAARRRELVAALACVDWVVGFRSDTPLALIERLRPDVLAKGGDWAADEIVGAAEVKAWGGRVVRLDLVPGEGTTRELARLRRPDRAGSGRPRQTKRSTLREAGASPSSRVRR